MAGKSATFRFYEELNDFLPPSRKKTQFTYWFKGTPSIKDAIEAMGVPHPEVDLILVNGSSVGFDYRLEDTDRVSVYPVFEGIDISSVTRLRDRPLRKSRFVLDVHLGRLARMLRTLGFDVRYENDAEDGQIVRVSVAERRIILTRDRRLLHAREVTHGYWVRATKPDLQVQEVLDRFDLYNQIAPFTRCSVCNGVVEQVAKEEILEQLEPRTILYFDTFYRCCDCLRIYWHGSHYQKMKDRLDRVIETKRPGGVEADESKESDGLTDSQRPHP